MNAVEVPAHAHGLELIGEMEASGYRNPPSLVRRPDGQTLQLTPLLYAVLEAVDGRRDHAEIAETVTARIGRGVSASDVATLVERQLRPRGLLLGADGSEQAVERSNPLLGLRLKIAVTDPTATRRLTDPFAALFQWWIWPPLVIVFGWVAWWLLMDRGLASAVYHAFAKPHLLLLVIAVTIVSAGFHEFGHAAAARRGGAQPGVMGAGLYLLWPAFYTDVTDTYRLGRAARIRTDLGGLYFNAIVAVAITGVWWFTGWDALLLVVAAQVLQMIRQLTPLVRFDGYHVLADVTGVPDLFGRIGPILTSFWPTRWNDPRVTQLKWWVRVVVTLWVLVVVPVLLLALIGLVVAAPRLVGTAWQSLGREWGQVGVHWSAGQYLEAVGAVLAMAAISLPVLAIGYIVGRVLTRVLTALWRRTEGRPIRRAGAGMLVAAACAMLVVAWWPNPDRYRPIQPYEGGTLVDLASLSLAAAGYDLPGERPMAGGEVATVLSGSGPMPTEAAPQLALVLVPRDSTTATDGTDAAAPAWVFPFNQPLPPEPGDNQAQAVNTTDHSVLYDVAVAMVWVTGDEPVLNVNEAYAFASCADCVTVAVAFQVVVIVGNANVVVPQNLSAAVNYECFECITAAVASQLVVTVDALPGTEQQLALADVWAEILAFAATIPTLPLADVIAQLEEYKQQILMILGVAPLTGPSVTPLPTGSPTISPSVSPSASGSNPASPGASVAPSSTALATPLPATPSPTAVPTPSGTPAPTPTPTPTPSSSAAGS